MWIEDSEYMHKSRQYVKHSWLIASTNTQLVERWVKDSNERTLSGKDKQYFKSDCDMPFRHNV